ncbi:MAG: serine protease [Tissierellia bacterium]|nr:serine protease [Tissierellia bacterium]
MSKSKVILILLVGLLTTLLSACSLEGISAKSDKNNNGQIEPKTELTKSAVDLSVDLLKESFQEDENCLISPISVLTALSMTANGADNETLSQMEVLLGRGLTIDEINNSLSSYLRKLDKDENIHIANSIWINDLGNAKVKNEFIDVNKEYYRAKISKESFDEKTRDKINSWVRKNTNGMIEKIIDRIHPNSIMYLINALAFEAEWDREYKSHEIYEDKFTNYQGSKTDIEMMVSDEEKYLEDGKAVGFIKPYKDNKYSFIALLPREDVDIKEYIRELTGEGLLNLINSFKRAKVDAHIPKFCYSYQVEMSQMLMNLGMVDAFDEHKADFSRMAKVENENIYINKVIHKTYIEVDEKGTKAAAATGVEVNETSAILEEERYVVKLDRPFIYVIMDNVMNLPIFIGTVMDIN